MDVDFLKTLFENSIALGTVVFILLMGGRYGLSVIRELHSEIKSMNGTLVEILRDNHKATSQLDSAMQNLAETTGQMAKMMLYFEKERSRKQGYEEALKELENGGN